MSRIYASGVKATALTQIKADLETYLSYNADGTLVLDTQGLEGYLRTQFDLVGSTEFVAPATAASAGAAARTADVGRLVSGINDNIKEEYWSSRTDWPTGTEVLQGAALVTAVKDSIAACKRAADAVTGHYADLNAKLSDYVTEFYYGQGVDATVTPAVLRNIETRAVIHTYVSDRNEESAPSPPSLLKELDQNDTATYTVADTVPTGRNIAKIRWYRSRSSNAAADFAFVSEVTYNSLDPATKSYTDSKKAEALGEPCPSITWTAPPADLIGVCAGANGGLGGFRFNSNVVRFSENFVPYAWPDDYLKTLAWPVVGLGSFDNAYVVLTTGKPYFIAGADSASLDVQEIDSNQACVSRRSIVNVAGGVLYASPDGVCLASQGGVKVLTEGLFTREDWQALTPSSIFATEYEGAYVFHSTGGCYALQLSDLTLRKLDVTGSAFFRDLLTDTLYIASGTTISSLFTSGSKRTATWKSKKATSERHENWGWAQVYADGAVTLKVYRDGVLTDTKTISNATPVRLSSKRALEHEIQIESAYRVTSVTCANTAEELRAL